MRYLSLFTGIGGFELGIEQAHEILHNVNRGSDGTSKENTEANERQGLFAKKRQEVGSSKGRVGELTPNLINERPLCIGYSEIDKYAIQIYEKHFPTHKNYGDITKTKTEDLPDFDLLVGGFPCQAFSIAGKRRGFDDTRGTLFFEIARILGAKRPRLFLLENVKGLLSHDGGRTFATIIATIDELGYDCQWQVLNSKNFGVPQNRERVFIVGHLRGTPRPQVFPIIDSNSKTIKRFQGDVSGRGFTSQQDRVYFPEGIMATLPAQRTENKINIFSKTVRSGGRASPHGSKQNWDSYEFDGKVRRLTPLECERLQGFPDGWTEVEGVSNTQRYKTLGNAVTVNVVRAIMERIITSQ